MTGIEFVPILVLGLVVYTLTNFVKFLTNRDWRSALTLIVGWAIGTAAVWLVGATDWGATIGVGGLKTLDLLSVAEKILVGLVVVSAGSTVYDLKRSFDNTDSAATPSIVPTHVPRPAVPPSPGEEPKGARV